MGKVIGIDLGTTNSCVAVVEGGRPIIIQNEEGQRTTPSVVFFSENGEILVGEMAKRKATVNPERTIFSIKRKMGTNFRITIDGKTYTPQSISALILEKLKKSAENYLGEAVTEAVITVPAYFNDAQRQATKEAGELAGLSVKRVINEPTAAAVAYGLDNEKKQTIMVYDLGGGTFDVSIIRVEDDLMEVLSTCGDTCLGGDDFDKEISKWIVSEFQHETGIDISSDLVAMQRINEAAENAKKELSSSKLTTINLPFIAIDSQGPKNINMKFSRAKLYELTQDLIEKTRLPVKNALTDARTKEADIKRILLVGGSTRMISAQEKVKEIMRKKPDNILNPDECVALGAAIQGDKMSGNSSGFELLLLDVTPLSLSTSVLGGTVDVLIPRNTSIPTKKSEVYQFVLDGTTEVTMDVYQGERKFAKDNKLLGSCFLKDIPPMKAGEAQIELTFSIDANGILSVSAKELLSQISVNTTIVPEAVSQAEIVAQIYNASISKEEEKDKLRAVEDMVKLSNLVNNAKMTLDTQSKRNPNRDFSKVRTIIREAEELIEIPEITDEVIREDTMGKKSRELMEAMRHLY